MYKPRGRVFIGDMPITMFLFHHRKKMKDLRNIKNISGITLNPENFLNFFNFIYKRNYSFVNEKLYLFGIIP